MASLDALRRYAVTRTLFPPTTLARALEKLGFVQADPIRAPARAQDLVLRHRVKGYRAGDLEQTYPRLRVEEAFFINYGFVPHRVYALMHPRETRRRSAWSSRPRRDERLTQAVLDFVVARKTAHPRDVDAELGTGKVVNWWGGQSSATTHLLDTLHYRGLLRIVRREAGIRVYGPAVPIPGRAARESGVRPPGSAASPTRPDEHENKHELTPAERVDALIDVVVGLYAPLPLSSLSYALGRLRFAVPNQVPEVRAGLKRAKARLAHWSGWYWPTREEPDGALDDQVRLLAPFDPIVWDRRRFEQLWGWAYRFEAYTPAPKRKWGYYALPLLFRERVVGWANVGAKTEVGWVSPSKKLRPSMRAVSEELERLRAFL